MNDFSSIYIFKISEIFKKPNKSRHIYPVTDIPTLCHLGPLIKIFLVCILVAYKVVFLYFCLIVTPRMVNQIP